MRNEKFGLGSARRALGQKKSAGDAQISDDGQWDAIKPASVARSARASYRHHATPDRLKRNDLPAMGIESASAQFAVDNWAITLLIRQRL